MDAAAARGLPWERAPLRGKNDLLDVEGCVPMGWLIGCKAKRPGVQDRMSEAMTEARRAWLRLPGDVQPHVTPVQILQRPRYPVGNAYAVMEYHDFLDLVTERDKAEW